MGRQLEALKKEEAVSTLRRCGSETCMGNTCLCSGGDHSRPGTPTAFMRTVPLAPRGWSLFVSAVTQSAKGQNLFSRPIVCILLEHGHVHCSYAVV
eukprot:scaffold88769_cov20-Tisochrysis_lutea.AAC.4